MSECGVKVRVGMGEYTVAKSFRTPSGVTLIVGERLDLVDEFAGFKKLYETNEGIRVIVPFEHSDCVVYGSL
jgi:hypothetical protein